MSAARAAVRIGLFLVIFVAVIAVYNLGANLLVRQVISQTKNSPPFPTTKFETSFGEFKGFGDGIIYKPERGGYRFGNR